MYVWCDALSNYITALGYGTEQFDEERWKDTTHVIGKDILRFHAAIWPGMLLSAGLPLPKKILVHGHITSGGHKMSKSIGNVIDPAELLSMFKESAGELAGEAVRFVLLHEIPSFEDGDMTMETIKASYTAHLANGIGNLTNRIMKMATSYGVEGPYVWKEENALFATFKNELAQDLSDNRIDFAVKKIFMFSQSVDLMIQEQEPFKVFKTDPEKAKEIVAICLTHLQFIGEQLAFCMPLTSAKILEHIRTNTMPEKPLFNRLP
jgi:methionyl-tRNA synthetase